MEWREQLNQQWQTGLSWFNSREPRERWLLILGLIAIIVGGWYNLIQQPLLAENQRLKKTNQQLQADVSWMRSVAPQLKNRSSSTNNSATGSILSMTDRSLKAAGLGNAVERIQPDSSNGSVKIWLSNASFSQLLKWLAAIEKQGFNVSVAGITPEDKNQPQGRVSARLTLERNR